MKLKPVKFNNLTFCDRRLYLPPDPRCSCNKCVVIKNQTHSAALVLHKIEMYFSISNVFIMIYKQCMIIFPKSFNSINALTVYSFPHSPLRIRHSAFTIPHSPLRILNSAFSTQHSPLHIRHSAFPTPQSLLRILHSAFSTPHSLLRILHSAFDTPDCPLRILYSAFSTLH